MLKIKFNLRNVAAIVACLAVAVKSRKLKRVSVRKITGSIVVATTLLVSGCAIQNAAVSSENAPFYLGYDSEDVIREQAKVATITSSCGLVIDGVVVRPQRLRSANAAGRNSQIVVADVLPGKHEVTITNLPSGEQVNFTAVTFDFEAGRIYDVSSIVFKVVIKENKSKEVARKIAENRNKAVFESPK